MTVYVVVLGVIPFGTLLLYSFYQDGLFEISHTLTTENYTELFNSATGSAFFTALFRTIVIALAVSAVTVPLAYGAAYACAIRMRRMRTFVFMLIVAPMFVSYVVKVFAMRGVLGERGIINYALMKLHLISDPLGFLLFNHFAVGLALVSAVLPFVFIPLYASLERVPVSLLMAGSDLGANPGMVLRRVLLPLTRRGIVAAATVSFILCLGDFIASQLLGGASGVLVGRLIYSSFGVQDDWPGGTARAVVLLAVAALVVIAFARIARGSSDGADVELSEGAR